MSCLSFALNTWTPHCPMDLACRWFVSISRVEKPAPSAGFNYDACRLGVSWSQAQSRRLSD